MRHLARPAGWVAVAAASVFLVLACWSLIQSGRGADVDRAKERDEVAQVAVKQLTTLNSMDAKLLDISMARWLEASTGELHDELKRDQITARATFARAGTTAIATVNGLAITALDTDRGDATLLASVRVRVTTGSGQDGSEQRKRYQVGMLRTPGGGWKIKSLIAIPAGGRS
ncbi:hypothetical protein SMC26_04750 [Actinomadura fulvescens]|uniref:Mce-associated membrane protein n=1 Tax=Actinomadura fulvescens TaxID=46160 RepID=A0ABN3PQV6_9ACTN